MAQFRRLREAILVPQPRMVIKTLGAFACDRARCFVRPLRWVSSTSKQKTSHFIIGRAQHQPERHQPQRNETRSQYRKALLSTFQ
jgi:hypothetical protein